MAYVPFTGVSEEYKKEAEQEGKGFISRAKEDIYSTVGKYVEGAKQGLEEYQRESNALADVADIDEWGNTTPKEGYTEEDVQSAQSLAGKAYGDFASETVAPVAGAAALVASLPYVGAAMGTAATASQVLYAPFLAKDVYGMYEKGGAGEVAKGLTYGGAQEFVSQDNLGEKFYKNPISTTASGVLSVLPPLMIGSSVAKGNIKGMISRTKKAKEEFTGVPIKEETPVVETGVIPEKVQEQELATTEKPAEKQPFEQTKDEYMADQRRKIESKYENPSESDYMDMASEAANNGDYNLAAQFARQGNDSAWERTYLSMGEKEASPHKAIVEEAIKRGEEVPENVIKEYADLKPEREKTLSEELGIVSEKEPIRTNIESTDEYKQRIKEVEEKTNEEIKNDPIYKAEDEFRLNLQLFSGKNAKEIAAAYKNKKLSSEQVEKFETIAEQNGMSGNKLAVKIIGNKPRAQYMKEILSKAKKEIIAEGKEQLSVSEKALEQVSKEAEALKGIANEEHVAYQSKLKEKDINARWKAAEQKLINQIEDAKRKMKAEEKLAKQKGEYQEKIKAIKEKYTAKIDSMENELKGIIKSKKEELSNYKKQVKSDANATKIWLKAEETAQKMARKSSETMSKALKGAKEAIEEWSLSDIKPGAWKQFSSSAMESAKRAEKEYRKGNYKEAAMLKTQEVKERAMALQLIKAEKEAAKINGNLKKYVNRGKSLLNMPEDYVYQIDSILQRHGLTEREPISTAAGAKSLADFVTDKNENYHDMYLPDIVTKGTSKPFTDMTLAEAREFNSAINSLSALGKKEKYFNSFVDKVDMDEAAKEAAASIKENAGEKYSKTALIGSEKKSVMGRITKPITELIDKVIPSSVNVLTLTRFLDGGKEGPMTKFVYNIMAKAEQTELRMQQKAKIDIKTMLEGYFKSEKDAKKRFKEKTYFEGIDRELTGEEILMVGMNWGNKANRDRILSGFNLTEKEVQPILDTLTKKDWDFIQGVWNYVDTYWEDAKNLEQRVSGIEPKKVEPLKVETKYGDYEGGYFPIKYDYNKSVKAFQTEEVRNALYKTEGAAKAMTEHGHLESRARSNNQPVKLSFNVLLEHLDNVIHDISFREAVIDVNKFIKKPDVKNAVTNAVGNSGYRTLDNWVKAIATDKGEGFGLGDSAFKWLRQKATMSTMGLKIAMFPIDSIGNFTNGISEIGTKRMVSAMKDFALNPREIIKTANENSQYMRNRSIIRDRDIWDLSKRWFENDSNLSHYAYQTMAWSDQLVSYPLWMERFKNALGEGKTAQDATLIADSAVKRSIGSGSILDVVGAQRGNELKKLFTMYYSWANMMFNRAWLSGKTSQVQWSKGARAQAIGTMAKATLFLWAIPALSDALIREQMRNEPEEKEDIPKNETPAQKKQREAREAKKQEKGVENKYGRISSRVISQPFGYVLGVRDVANYVVNKITGQYGDFRVTPVETTIGNFGKMIGKTIKMTEPEEEEKPSKRVLTAQEKKEKAEKKQKKEEAEKLKYYEDLSKAAGSIAGIPQQANTWAFNFIDYLNSEDGELTWKDLLTRRQKEK